MVLSKAWGCRASPHILGLWVGVGNGLVTELTGEHCPPQKFWGWGWGLGLNVEGEGILKGLAGGCPHGPACTDTAPLLAPHLGCPPTPGSGCLILGSVYGTLDIHGAGEAGRNTRGGRGHQFSLREESLLSSVQAPQAEYSESQECRDQEPLVTVAPHSPLPLLFSLQKKCLASFLHPGSYTSSKPSSKSTSSVKPSLDALGLTTHPHNALQSPDPWHTGL